MKINHRWLLVLLSLGCFSLVLFILANTPRIPTKAEAIRRLKSKGLSVASCVTQDGHKFELVSTGSDFERLDGLTDRDLISLRAFPNLEELYLTHCLISNEGMRHVAELQDLRVLWINQSHVGHGGLAPLAKLKNIEGIVANVDDSYHGQQTSLDDDDMAALGNMSSLRYLNLQGNPISDAGLVHLRKLTNLKELDLWRCGTSEKAENAIRAALPTCSVRGSAGWPIPGPFLIGFPVSVPPVRNTMKAQEPICTDITNNGTH